MNLTVTWLIIAAALTFFTFTVAATAGGSKPDYAGAAGELPPGTAKIVIKKGKKEVCTVNASQLSLLEAHYTVGRMTVTVDGVSEDLVTVDGAKGGAKDKDLHQLLGDMKCKLVQEKHVFYLPFDAQTS